MEDVFSHQFRSASIVAFSFFGLAFVGCGLGLMFWLDFRKRFPKGGHRAGLIVMIVAIFLGVVFGYQATQPAYFKKLTANRDGISLEYYLFTKDVVLGWNNIESISVQEDQLLINGKRGERYRSPVVYRGDQARLLRSITQLRPNDNP